MNQRYQNQRITKEAFEKICYQTHDQSQLIVFKKTKLPELSGFIKKGLTLFPKILSC